MIRVNQRKIEDTKIKGKAGFDANESRFGGWERELREHKVLTVPAVNNDNCVTLEQGWNLKAKNKDVVRVVVLDDEIDVEVEAIVTREELEQALAYLAQGEELIKYVSPKIRYD